MLFDALKVQKNENHKQILYDEEHVYKALRQTSTLPYHNEFNFKGIRIKFFDAGHILGAATVEITVKQ